jgi:cation:H+ antiporter
MLEAWGYFLLGLVLLALGGDSIVKGASGLAQKLGASPFIAGLLLIAFGTSLPELAVNARAIWVGAQDLALGNAVGSNIVNLGLTLGAAALAAPVLVRLRVLSPLLVLLAVATLALIVFGLDGVISRLEGVALLLVFVAMLTFLLARARHEQPEVQAGVIEYASTRVVLWMNLLRFAVAVALLYFGAKFVVQGAPVIGVQWGLSPLLVGLLPVAIGTALPEVAAAIAAARRGQGDMVAGHVIGSCLWWSAAWPRSARCRCRSRLCGWNCQPPSPSCWCCIRCCAAICASAATREWCWCWRSSDGWCWSCCC